MNRLARACTTQWCASILLVGVLAGGAMKGECLLADYRRDSVSLDGTWLALPGHSDEKVWRPEVAEKMKWQEVDVPGPVLPLSDESDRTAAVRDTVGVWVRRSVELSPDRARRNALLKWATIRFGATVWVNGVEVDRCVPICPHTVFLPAGALRAGANEIVMWIPGWAGVQKSASGYPLTPTGGSTQAWGTKVPGIYGDIWLEFYDGVCVKSVLAVADIRRKTVSFRYHLAGVEQVSDATVSVNVCLKDSEKTEGAAARPHAPSEGEIAVVLPEMQAWSPESPVLYTARVAVEAGGRVKDRVEFDFGMREISVRNGRFFLNGKPLWLRGSNLVNEWRWGDLYNRQVKRYLIDEARLMNLNCFRTHTEPPPTLWVETADRHGMMILAEFPVLYNHADFNFTDEEKEVFHRNALADAEGWVTKLWNHPSVIIWVLSNESVHDNEWEKGPFYRFVKNLDPTRPCMRTGHDEDAGLINDGTPDILDIHTCFNYNCGPEGKLLAQVAEQARKKDPRRPLTNTEYMNLFGGESLRWNGQEKHPDEKLTFAECCAEHTEAMRRLRYDGILPYMYAGWTGLRGTTWRDDYPTPMAAALHSVMSPVLASIDLFDRNFIAGSRQTAPVVLINELDREVKARLDFFLTEKNPLFVPDENALKAALWSEERQVTFPSGSVRTMRVSWRMPEKEGVYYLAAVVRREGDSPVVSQRTVRSICPPARDALAGTRILLLGGDKTIASWCRAHGAAVVSGASGRVDADCALVWDESAVSPSLRQVLTGPLTTFLEGGGRAVVADQKGWTWKEFVNCEIGKGVRRTRDRVVGSRAFAFPEASGHRIFDGINPEFLKRWNGLPGTICDETIIDTTAIPESRRLLWVSHPRNTAALSVPVGKGEIVFCQLQVRRRIAPDSPDYDPVAERILVNLLKKQGR